MAASAAIGLFSLALIMILTRAVPKIPAVLVAVVTAIVLSLLLDLESRGVSVVGALPQGLPAFTLPKVGLSDLGLLFAGAVGIALVALADTISTAASFAERRGETVDGNREMVGIGTANIAAGLFQGFPVSTSGSRTAVAEQSGARTQVAGLTGALGILIAVLISIGDVFRRIWMPNRTTLGRTGGLEGLHDVTTHPDALVLPWCPVYRFDAPLIFANAATFREDVRRLVAADPRPAWIVVAAESISDVDTTACDMLDHLVESLDADGTRLVFAEMKGTVLAKLRSLGLERLAGDEHFPPTLDGALESYLALHPADTGRAADARGEGP